MSAGNRVLTVKDLDAGYGDLQVVFGVDLHVDRGQQVLIFGPNGAGKSTVVKALVALVDIYSGSVQLQERELRGESTEWIVRQGLGYVPQLSNVFPSLTVAENLDMGSILQQHDGDRRGDMYDLFPMLYDKRRQPARTLSGGQRQMLAMARALMGEPRLLVLDEPTAGLAPSLVDDMFATIGRINDRGVSVLMVEQNARQALEHVDYGYVLQGGQVRYSDAAAELLARDDIGRLYLGGAEE